MIGVRNDNRAVFLVLFSLPPQLRFNEETIRNKENDYAKQNRKRTIWWFGKEANHSKIDNLSYYFVRVPREISFLTNKMSIDPYSSHKTQHSELALACKNPAI